MCMVDTILFVDIDREDVNWVTLIGINAHRSNFEWNDASIGVCGVLCDQRALIDVIQSNECIWVCL